MNQEEKDIALIDKFVKGELSGETLAGFEQRLATDVDFAEQVHWHKKLVTGIKKQSRTELKSYLQSLEENSVSTQPNTKQPAKVISAHFWKYAIAAAVALLIIAVFWINESQPSPEALFAQYYQPYPNVEATIERNETEVDSYTQAFQWYEDGQYEEAAAAFEQLLQTNADAEALNFYAGLTAIERNQPENALEYLEKVITNPGHKFYQQALWYASLAALKSEDTDRAKPYLQQLSGVSGFYRDKAAQLLEEL